MRSKCEKCESINIHFVKYKMKNNVDILRQQCLDCGRLHTRSLKRITVKNFQSLPYADLEARERYREKSISKYNIKKDFEHERSLSFIKSQDYYRNVYLKSDAWKRKRNLIMDYYDYKCQNCESKATDVHHLSYDNIFIEKFSDLMPLCRSCHDKEHDTESTPTKVSYISMSDIQDRHVVVEKETYKRKVSSLSLSDIMRKQEDKRRK